MAPRACLMESATIDAYAVDILEASAATLLSKACARLKAPAKSFKNDEI